MKLAYQTLLLAAFSASTFAQLPDGKDIATAVPILIGQNFEDAGSAATGSDRVYSINLARGQRVTFTRTMTQTNSWCGSLALYSPTSRSVAQGERVAGDRACRGNETASIDFTVPATGVYFLNVFFGGGSGSYRLQISATGTPIALPNPTRAGCLSGRVESITYSLQFIALGIPDELTIGGQRVCPSCQVKAPIYTEMAARLDAAMNAGTAVEACYDSAGSIFQIKLSK